MTNAPTTRETADHADHIGEATTMIDHAELAACPFCGGKATLHDGMGEFWVRCDDCGASGSMRSRQDRAVRDWNARPSEAALLSEIAALRVREAALIDGKTDMFRRATQAERQRDEAVGLLTDLASWFVASPTKGTAWVIPSGALGADDAVSAARTFLANQGADQ